MADEPDADLLRRFSRGDGNAFETLFRRFERDVYRWIVRIVRDPNAAEDLTVEAFWRAYRGRARFDPARSFGAWMRRIATNAACDHLAAARRRPATVPISSEPATVPPGDSGTAAAILLAFQRLPAKLRVAAVLALVEQLPYDEIADVLDVPVGTVKSRVFRATRALRAELTRMGIRS